MSLNTINSIYFLISTIIERPSKEHCDKFCQINSTNACFTYYTESNKQTQFKNPYIYLTIECIRECSLIMVVNFGKNNFINMHSNERIPIVAEEKRHPKMLPEPLMLRVRPITPAKLKVSMKIVKQFSRDKKHRKYVLSVKRKRDEEDRIKKFLSSNQIEINRKFAQLISKHQHKIKDYKESILLWISYAKLFMISIWLYNRIILVRKKRERDQTKLYNAIKIYIFIKSKLARTSGLPKERFNYRLILYFILYSL